MLTSQLACITYQPHPLKMMGEEQDSSQLTVLCTSLVQVYFHNIVVDGCGTQLGVAKLCTSRSSPSCNFVDCYMILCGYILYRYPQHTVLCVYVVASFPGSRGEPGNEAMYVVDYTLLRTCAR